MINIGAHADSHLAAGCVDVGSVVPARGEKDCEAWPAAGRADRPRIFSDTIWSRASRSVAASRSLLAAVVSGIRASVGQPTLQHGDVVRWDSDPVPQPIELVSERTKLGYQGFAVLIRPAIMDRSGHDTPPVEDPTRAGCAVPCNLSPYAPGAGRRLRNGAVNPGASRRAVITNPVWPTMSCRGRTASPSTCQARTSDSVASGSVKPPCTRSVSTVCASWVVVAT